MAIKILRKGLPIVGRVKIGEPGIPKGNKKAPPVKHDHLELTGVERDENGCLYPDVELMRDILALGARTCGGCARSRQLAEQYAMPELADGLPRELLILLPFDDPEVNFPHRLAWHRGRTEFCSGDGETAQRRTITGYEGDDRERPIFGETRPHGPCGNECPDFLERCKPKARLRFVLGHQASVGGVYEFQTTSWASIANIQNSIATIQQMTGGVLQWIPFVLDIVPQTVQPRRGGGAQTAWIARVYYRGNPIELLSQVRENLKLRAPMLQEIRQLEASIKSDDWSEEEIEDFRAEFDHEGVESEGAIDVEAAPEPVEPPSGDDDAPASAEAQATDPALIDETDRARLWSECQKRAAKFGPAVTGARILRAAAHRAGVERTEEIPADRFDDLLEFVRSYKP